MFNLLPKAEKDTIRREYRVRLAIVMLWFLLATIALAAFLIVPTWFLSREKETAAARRFAALEESIARRESAGLDKELSAAGEEVKLLSREAPAHYLYEVVRAIVAQKPAGVSLESVTISEAREGKRTVHLSGTAAERGALVTFSRALEKLPFTEQVDLPLQNLARERDLTFSVSITAALAPQKRP